VPHTAFNADTAGSSAFYDDSNNAPIDTQLFSSQPRPPSPSEMLSTTLQHAVHFNPWPRSPTYPSPHGLPPSTGAPAFVLPSDVMLLSPSAVGSHVRSPEVHGLSTPPELTDEGESEASNGDDDCNSLPNRTSRTRLRRTSSVSSLSGSVRPLRPCRLIAPVPVPYLTREVARRRPRCSWCGALCRKICGCTGAPSKDASSAFARGEHLKRHI
jgi:hypothetical protein